MDIEKLVREGLSFAEITRKMNEEIAAAQRKLEAERKEAEKAATRSKQLESAHKQFKSAFINYLDALGVLEGYNTNDLQEIEEMVDKLIAAVEKSVKISKVPNGTKIEAKYSGNEDVLGKLFNDTAIIKNFIKGLF